MASGRYGEPDGWEPLAGQLMVEDSVWHKHLAGAAQQPSRNACALLGRCDMSNRMGREQRSSD